MTEPIAGWIWGRNRRAFLELLSRYAGYALDGTDWDTIEAGGQEVSVSVTGAGTSELRLRTDTLLSAFAGV
ncbi:hypothetical protein ACFY6U_12265 [Streptomyces sp. NPDC013157]|uniref:hypothetical protein n=1 Tax=Streptomyces sp. NPDC013157 TaxID=3364861 RepID=UPI0036AAF582